MTLKLDEYSLELKDVAHTLGVSPNAVRRLAAAGKIHSEKFGPLHELRFRQEDVDAFLEKAEPHKAHRQIVQRIKATSPHYQGQVNPESHH